MKKAILIVAAMAFTASIGSQAFACYWDGYWGGPMGGSMAGYHNGNYQGFYDQTAQLRQDLAAKQSEYNALMATSTPDPKQTAELNREIAVLHDQLSAQARSFNLPPGNARYYSRMGGYGWCW